ncbi:MAG: response regulator [Bacteroidales bacterium]|jgi:CheY-like chemotaxis protein|nr:response regulator [Bacteroidales bacterium]
MVDISNLSGFKWNNKTIVIAEDEESNFRFLEMVLVRTGAKILWAFDGLEAIELVKTNHPDLVLMDIKMPNLDGLEATRRLKILFPEIPIVMQTAYAMASDEKQSYEAGCDGYISKPIRAKKLIEVVAKFLE